MTQANKQAGLVGAMRGCVSWQDIQAKWRTFPEKQKGDLFEELVKAYLQLEPEYASKLKHIWLQRDVPQAIARKLKLPVTDQGIDIIAETHDGEFWAVQCKYRQDTDHSLTWREISTFTGLAFGVCCGFSFGVVCSTTERVTHVLKDQERIGFCALDVWQALDADFLKRLRAHLAHKPGLLKSLKPKPHQKGAVKDGHEHFVIGKATRGKLIMPCGSGKSLTAYWIAGELESRRIVIAVPSLALIRQTLKVWLRETMANQKAVEWICVCSDESAGRVERDDSAVLRQDLGVPCITDPKEIAVWLKRKHIGLTVVFTTYQSGETLAKAARAAKFTFDLGIMDEAHKTVGDGGKLFSHLLHDKNLTIRRRLYMTATERRYKGQSDTVLSMDDPAIVQAVGRALRPAPDKQFGYVIVPILHDAEATADDIFKSPAFKEILTTLRALAANDDRIIEYFRGVSQGQQRKGGGSVQFDIDERLAKRIDLADFVREIELKCWDRLAKLSWRPFEEAREFARGLGLKSNTEWRAFRKGSLPNMECPARSPYLWRTKTLRFCKGFRKRKERRWASFWRGRPGA